MFQRFLARGEVVDAGLLIMWVCSLELLQESGTLEPLKRNRRR